MPTKKPLVKRNRTKIIRNSSRVITRAHIPEIARIPKIIARVANLSEEKADEILHSVNGNFITRHKNIEAVFRENYDKISRYITKEPQLSTTKQLLIGAFFTMEYSIESAALFNPSMVPHPDQSGLASGALRFIMSLRATGEGHISSIVFRSGVLREDCSFLIDPVSEYLETPTIRHDQSYDTHLFQTKLKSMKIHGDTIDRVFKKLPAQFTFDELKTRISSLQLKNKEGIDKEILQNINWLADSNYFIRFDSRNDISERVIFPLSENENRGIEDARFVRFIEEDKEPIYYATYTAYNGIRILPQLLVTSDFLNFDILTLNGKAVQNKGMALFPRKIDGKYVMLSRQDGENNYIMFSDNMHFWDTAKMIQEPELPWEFFQIGNCGSPIELKEGWLVLTHGVGAMRQYSIGAVLLDLKDPSKMIARLEEPLLTPNEEEREGYVPNVVYSCGGLIHQDTLIIPYAMSDISSGISSVKLSELIASMVPYN
jgi:predicted GH43/DUF377 family glycosyl hydrolase